MTKTFWIHKHMGGWDITADYPSGMPYEVYEPRQFPLPDGLHVGESVTGENHLYDASGEYYELFFERYAQRGDQYPEVWTAVSARKRYTIEEIL